MQLALPFYFRATQLDAIRGIERDAGGVERHDVAPMRHRHDAKARAEWFQASPAAFVFAGDLPFYPVAPRDVVAHQIGKIDVRTIVNIPHLVAHDGSRIETLCRAQIRVGQQHDFLRCAPRIGDEAVGVDAGDAKQQRRIQRGLRHILIVGGAGAHRDIGIASGVDDDFGAHLAQTRLVVHPYSGDPARLNHHVDQYRVQRKIDARGIRHFE